MTRLTPGGMRAQNHQHKQKAEAHMLLERRADDQGKLDTPIGGTAVVDRRRSVLHEGISINGDWTSHGIVEFGGEIVGNLNVDTLVLTRNGRVAGHVRAHSVTIEGTLDGTISAALVTIRSRAHVTADIVAERISIEAGAEVDGKIRVTGGTTYQSGSSVV